MSIEHNEQLWKRSIQYYRCGHMITEELTFEKFIMGLQNGMEFFFTYNHHTIDFAFHFDNSKLFYEVNIDGYSDSANHYTFGAIDELLRSPILASKTIVELWEELKT